MSITLEKSKDAWALGARVLVCGCLFVGDVRVGCCAGTKDRKNQSLCSTNIVALSLCSTNIVALSVFESFFYPAEDDDEEEGEEDDEVTDEDLDAADAAALAAYSGGEPVGMSMLCDYVARVCQEDAGGKRRLHTTHFWIQRLIEMRALCVRPPWRHAA